MKIHKVFKNNIQGCSTPLTIKSIKVESEAYVVTAKIYVESLKLQRRIEFQPNSEALNLHLGILDLSPPPLFFLVLEMACFDV